MIKDTKQPCILSLGSINADFQVRVDQDPAGITTMLAHDFVRLSGGKAANVAYVARRLGVPALLMAHTGKDDLEDQALRGLQDIGVDLSYVKSIKDVSTGVSMISVPPDGKKKIILAPNANDVWKQSDRDEVRKAIEQAPKGSVLVVDYEIPPFIVEEAIKTAHEMGLFIILDPSPPKRVDPQLLVRVHCLMPDASETESLTGIKPDSAENAIHAARELLEKGVQTAVVRMEEGGCVVAQKENLLHLPPVAVDVVDTTGAGDAFAGGLAVAMLEKRQIKEAVCFASAVSMASLSAYGSQPAYPSREQVQGLYDQLKRQIRSIRS